MKYRTQEERLQNKEKWIERMQNWQASGLNVTAWCRDEGVKYHTFLYWKKRLLPGQGEKFDSETFIELDNQSESSGIEIVLDEITVRLSKDFDCMTLHRCIKTLKDLKC